MAQPLMALVVAERSLPGADVDAIEAALGELRRSEERAAVRTAVATMVAVADAGRCTEALETASKLTAAHPVHCIAIVPGDPAGPAHIDATVRVRVLPIGERVVCAEDVRLEVAGPALGHLDSIVEPLTLGDLPVVVWYPGRLPPGDDPLLAAADRVIVDTKEIGGAAAFPAVQALARRFPVVDLSWVRLTPWRELLAGLFEGEAFRPFLDGVQVVRVEGKPAPSRLMAGWVLSRLGLDAAVARVREAVHVTIELETAHAGRTARFRVARPDDERIVTASAEVDGGPAHRRVLRLRPRDPARVLGQALARLGHDRIWEEALAAASGLGA